MKKYDFLIFDLDDTLLDFQDTEIKALESLFKKYEVPFNEESVSAYKAMNKKLWAEIEKGSLSKADLLNQRFAAFFELYEKKVDGQLAEKEYRSLLNLGHKMLDGALALLTALKNHGYTIVAGTNGIGITQRQRLTDAKIIDFFDDLFISEEVGFEKPNTQFFEAIFKKYPAMTKENTLMIGDSLSSDIKGATNAGIDSVWMNPTKAPHNGIESTYEVQTLDELLALLGEEVASME
ncbi:YjjG family noncanonical pyrimidine nucleotidase [Rummeliibacillus sp. TYF-LIM-RU47]|uniref:YjjG family noncanonical pyrimidine nucleotidase n=1 Tax=Rummeliibacillus sp. TYF-LIM-RU47 TaxID=2608406 RepID=UPI0012384065|nr:YjjG family noncanonical pyrimidine nucleotidase [Rummeliibacillus sp. TYF-LIM-RU47]